MSSETIPTVSIYSEMAAKLNFACHQSAFAFLRDLRVENKNHEERIDNLLVTLSSDPDFLKPKSWRMDSVAPKGSISVNDRDIELDGGFLLNLSDSLRGTVKITVEKDGLIIAEETKPVELLSYNEWGGAGYMPELLAAFSMPNDPAIDRVLRDASLILRKAGKPDGIDGYKAGSRQRVWEIASAIYAAIANQGITYAVPPASFERDGQKIRLPNQIWSNRIATCLDTTMLFVSAFEQAGLNPIVAMPQGHAVAGVWLQPEELSTIVLDEAETLRKRIQLKELILIETTHVTSHPAPPFSKAVNTATEKILIDKDVSFNSAVDIKRARAHRISPLGLKTESAPGEAAGADSQSISLTLEDAPALPDFDEGVEDEVLPKTPDGRLDRWQRKLLDLSARNPLLNHRSIKASLKIICPDPGLLEDKLSEGARISIQPVHQPSVQSQDEEIHRRRTGEKITDEYARDALNKNQVLIDLAPEKLENRAVEIYRKAQTSLQEGGANTLYLALGFLFWKRNEKDEKQFRAPLILLPVTLDRKSVRSGIKILAHDDEPRFNMTLLEMLRKDFLIDIKGLDGDLPGDHSGIDVGEIWNTVRKSVKEVPGFEVVEDIVLGHFSFAKYLMWKDLVDRTNALRENAIVQHLIDTPHDPYPSYISFIDGHHIDRNFKPSDLLTPLPADSSQMAAIATADRGKDFIIIGPPGTGKSQTISNLIAHMLGKGKTVLFVSEKMAALEVVYRRLNDIKLGRFCLKLHSNNARKADVLSRLRAAWDTRQSEKDKVWEKEAEKLRELRDQLNLVVERLHFPRRNGMTAHYAIGIKVRDENLASHLTFSWPTADHHDEEQLAEMRAAVENLKTQVAAVGDVSGTPFQLVAEGNWSPKWQEKVFEVAGHLSSAASAAGRACTSFLDAVGISIPDQSLERLDAVSELAAVLVDSYRKQTAFALEPDGQDRIEALEEAVKQLKAYATAQSDLSCAYEPMAWRQLDGREIDRLWQEAEAAWWPKSSFLHRVVIKNMKKGGAKGTPDPKNDAALLTELRVKGEAIDALDKQLSIFKDWDGHATYPETVLAIHDLGIKARVAVGKLTDDVQSLAEVRGKIRTLMYDDNDLLAPETSIGRSAQVFMRENQELQQAQKMFESISGGEVRKHFSETQQALSAIKEAAEDIASRSAELHDWCGWRRRRSEAIDLELGPLVNAIENGRVPTDDIMDTFEAAYCSWWSGAIIGEDDVLRTFSTPEHVSVIEKFREIDGRFQDLTAAYIEAKLEGNLPDSEDVNRKSSWGILKRELQKKKQHKTVRQLVKEIPDVLTVLAPCLMMSPLSVAQYLPAEQQLFDVVIFDEASQISVWDAVGTLARGRQVIMAGDPKQMPPTNFFSRSDNDPDGDVDVEGDLESILDEMIGANIPQKTLNFHYRSRRESLIAFSNSRYYDNGLVTFPAPVHRDNGVRLIHLEGYYARGKARHNQGEARAIVNEVLRRITHEDEGVRKLSIGVVTFNSEQQTLIENLLDAERSKNPAIEWAFSSDKTSEPVFVKNLETVQGDERDVILFSVTYGPDESNHVTMNFGPLNRDGGERRLNVAMTRARFEMMVFSILHPDRIDLSRTQARAVADLKHFLEYARRGPSALARSVYGSVGDFDSPFELAVARSLRDKGWDVHPQVGVSSYRIDLGIVHRDFPGIYLAGVECDGAMYHSSAFARERDKIRQSVLEGLGWTLFRVWSTDWWTNREKALGTLCSSLDAHLESDRKRRREEAEVGDQEGASTPEDDDTVDVSSEDDNVGFVSEDENPVERPPYTGLDFIRPADNIAAGFSGDTATQDDLEPQLFDCEEYKYRIVEFESVSFKPDPDLFYSDEYQTRLSTMIDHVIDREGPIHEDVLVRRIARHHGFQRSGRQIRNIVIDLAKKRRGKTKEYVGLFFWQKGTVKDRNAPARYMGRDDEMKKVEYICQEEIVGIRDALSLGNDVVALARKIGLSRLKNVARNRLEQALRADDSLVRRRR